VIASTPISSFVEQAAEHGPQHEHADRARDRRGRRDDRVAPAAT
jgi:hypothetical protein